MKTSCITLILSFLEKPFKQPMDKPGVRFLDFRRYTSDFFISRERKASAVAARYNFYDYTSLMNLV